MNKFWEFEKTFLSDFLQNREAPNVVDFLDTSDLKTIQSDLKYGNTEYLSDSIIFLPSKSTTKVIIMNLVLGNNNAGDIQSKLLSKIEYPYQLAVDFWAIGDSISGPLVVYPSFGTSINSIKLVKNDQALDKIIKEISSDNLPEKIFIKHSSIRKTIISSGLNLKKLVALWVYIGKRGQIM